MESGGYSLVELTVDAVISSTTAVTSFVDQQLEALDCPMKAQLQIDVALDELFSNIANYAYPEGGGKATIRFSCDESRVVSITFADQGIPYDPLQKPDPDVTLSAAERSIGGLGIFLVKKTMDDMFYEYKDGQNLLTIRKQI